MAEKRIRIEESRGKLGVLLICEVPSAPPLPGGVEAMPGSRRFF